MTRNLQTEKRESIIKRNKNTGTTPSASGHSIGASAAAALLYGSQHLRFRNEWLLCTAYGLGLSQLPSLADGSLVPSLCASVVFAVFRHMRRIGQDARRVHAQ